MVRAKTERYQIVPRLKRSRYMCKTGSREEVTGDIFLSHIFTGLCVINRICIESVFLYGYLSVHFYLFLISDTILKNIIIISFIVTENVS